jgi:hypothetical protein
MVIPDPDRDRQYALDFARGALEHYYSVGPDQLHLRERATNLITGDMLAISVEQLLDELDPGGPKPWLHRPAPADQWQPGPADQPTTVSITEYCGDEGWCPTWPTGLGGSKR